MKLNIDEWLLICEGLRYGTNVRNSQSGNRGLPREKQSQHADTAMAMTKLRTKIMSHVLGQEIEVGDVKDQ